MRLEPRAPREDVNVSGEHPLREVGVLLAGALALMVGLALLAGFAVDLGAGLVSMETEQEVFGSIRGELLERVSVTQDASALPALREAFEGVLAALPEPLPMDFELRLACLEEPNALALPGGGVVLTSGLARHLRTADQLAFVLAHELAHFMHRDHLRGLGRAVVVSLALRSLLSAGGLDQGAALQAATEATRGAHSRSQEEAADAFALSLLVRTRGHGAGAVDALEVLRALSDEGWVDRLDLTRSHPVGAARLAALRATAAAHGWSLRGEQAPLPDALRRSCAGEAGEEEPTPPKGNQLSRGSPSTTT